MLLGIPRFVLPVSIQQADADKYRHGGRNAERIYVKEPKARAGDQQNESKRKEVALADLGSSIDVAQYRKKVTQYLKGHLDHLVVKKLRDNIPVEKAELSRLETSLYALGGDEGTALFESIRQGKSLGAFIRGLVGLDREAAKAAFGAYLEGSQFNTNQIAFVNQIVDYLTQNGVMEPARLYEQPFTSFSMNGLDGVFSDKDAEDIMRVVRSINANAGIALLPTFAQ